MCYNYIILSQQVKKCGKNVKAKTSEAMVEHKVHVRVLNVHVLGPNMHL